MRNACARSAFKPNLRTLSLEGCPKLCIWDSKGCSILGFTRSKFLLPNEPLFSYLQVHHHHDIEETIFFPALVARCGFIPERMSEDHGSLMRMLDEIRAMEAWFEPQTLGIPSAPHQRLAAEELRQLVANLAAELREHLNEEERFFTPVIKAHFTKKEHQEVSRGAVSCFDVDSSGHKQQWLGVLKSAGEGQGDLRRWICLLVGSWKLNLTAPVGPTIACKCNQCSSSVICNMLSRQRMLLLCSVCSLTGFMLSAFLGWSHGCCLMEFMASRSKRVKQSRTSSLLALPARQ
jgi:hypothetical protein